jgi:hypothetical protein
MWRRVRGLLNWLRCTSCGAVGIGRALLVAQVAVVLLIARNWAYVTTYRLFLDRRIAAAASAAAQQFDIEGARVVPLIVTRGADRVAFATEVGQDSTIHAVLRPGPAATTYAIEWQHGPGASRPGARPDQRTNDIACAYPGGSGVIALVSQGAVTWVDPRVVRDLRFVPHAVTLTVLFLGWIAFTRDRPDGDVTGGHRLRPSGSRRQRSVCSAHCSSRKPHSARWATGSRAGSPASGTISAK